MKYLETKEGSLEEAISQAINEKPDSSKDLKEDVNAKELEEAGGKYLKYSDLLLQKGRLIQQGKPTTMIDREISKEMKKLGIKEATGDKEEYTKFFNAALKKFGVKSPADFKDDAKKKEFFNYVDKNYKGDHEEELDKEDKPTVQKVIDKLKKASKAHADQSKSLEKDLQDDVDKTIDTIQQANDSKRQSMRSILADIWNMKEGKSPFEKEPMSFEGFASDAQRRAAFASGYKEKGKKKKEEVEDPIKKTLTGKKPTKVEVEPKIK